MVFAAYWTFLFVSVILRCQLNQAQTTSIWWYSQSDFSCDFERTCYYNDISQDRNDDFDWSRSYYSPPVWRGYNMYISEQNKRPGQVARFKTPVISPPRGSSYCIQFSYILMGPYVGQLEVITENESHGVSDPIWISSGLQGPYWNTEYIDYQPTNSFRVIFKATVGSIPFNSYIGIDNLEVYGGECQSTPLPSQSPILSELDCDFESNSDLCGFTSMEQSRWRHAGAGSYSYSYLPNEDHTLNLGSGHYIFSSYDEAVLYSPLLTSSGSETCFSFWYYLQPRSNGELLIYLQSFNGHIGDPLAVTSSPGHGAGQWQLQNVPLRATVPATFYIVLIFSRKYYTGIGIDDFLYKHTPCSWWPLQATIGNCNFEQSLDECGYIQGGTNEDDFDWNLAEGPITMADGTRPNADHSFGNSSGHYMYIQSSFPVAGNTAKLFTPKLTSTKNPRCLTFWYYIDQDVGKLEVYLEILDAVDKIWYSKTPTENQWKLAKVDIVPISSDFTILFQATVGESYYRGAIAIDDIMLDDCESVVNHIATFSCDFENDIAGCGLFQRYDDDLDWLYFNNYGVHGLSDSSTYMYVEGGEEDKACIQTPPINYNGSISVGFSVHMNFDPQLNLRVFIQEEWNYNKKKLIWEKNGITQGWEQVNVMKVNQSMTMFAILFEAVLGPSSLGVIAVDDINIYPDNTSLKDDRKSNSIIITATVVPLVVIFAIAILLVIFRKPWMNKPKDGPRTTSTKNVDSDAYTNYEEDVYENAYTSPL
ncbi:MAM and LDL-receptor class A domain-containing protein 1-like isoform X2 [Anneissia japonica]|uniref:MAM and LDL-receptor class A domain-containing protein 1-like isoform X2 n=1 Tax=Anneissia japonica TaxID=1529436 RepID=UPI00142588FA|nr:MAM and LDL-receptor class A domain-containing protein 1-like isoform X2 [Anneissia japonica]